MVDGDLCRNRHQPDSIPHWMALLPLNEQVAFPGAIVGGGNSQRVEVPALDVVADSIAIQVCVEKVLQRSRV